MTDQPDFLLAVTGILNKMNQGQSNNLALTAMGQAICLASIIDYLHQQKVIDKDAMRRHLAASQKNFEEAGADPLALAQIEMLCRSLDILQRSPEELRSMFRVVDTEGDPQPKE